MSSKVTQKRAKKARISQKPEAIGISSQPEVEQILVPKQPEPEPEPEPEHEVETERVEDQEADDIKEDGKNQKKKLIYEELKIDIDEFLNKVLADIAEAKVAKNKGLQVTLKGYEKHLKKIKANVKKVEPKDKKTVIRSQPSGFNKPLPITEEIAEFAGWNPNELKSRTDVTVSLCQYVKSKNLQNPDHKRTIIPDEYLCKILKYDRDTEPPLTYSTMQKYIGHLFKTEAVSA